MKRVPIAPREDWKDKAQEAGFGFHTMYEEPYWSDDLMYEFTLDQIENDIEDVSNELHRMCLTAVDEIVKSDTQMQRLGIPAKTMDVIRKSWNAGDRHLYGRFDFAYDGTGPAKMLEYNADTPTSIFEAAYFQANWLVDQTEAGRLPKGTDQYNFLQESLVEAFTCFPKNRIFHFACWTDNIEDAGTTAYLADCARQAGYETKMVDIQQIGVDAQGRYTDQDDITIDLCFKLYPWEDMLRERYVRFLKPSVFVEPIWKSIISNKGFLALLWEMNQGHPNLLETHIESEMKAPWPKDCVIKPFLSREGQNVIIMQDGKILEEAEGDYESGDRIVQERAKLFVENGRHAILGSWVIGDRACGLGIREDSGLITKDMSRFVPHIITV